LEQSMNQRWSMTALASGAAVLLADGPIAYFKIETQLKLADLTSGNPTWLRPAPTRFDKFVLGVPVGAILITGVVLLAVGHVGKRRQKFRQ
jgi:hypothetical protein